MDKQTTPSLTFFYNFLGWDSVMFIETYPDYQIQKRGKTSLSNHTILWPHATEENIVQF